MSPAGKEALIRRAIDAIWNRGDLDVADQLFASNYVSHNGLITDVVLGPEAIKISAALHRLAFPDLRVVVDDVSTDEGILVVHWTASSGRMGQAARMRRSGSPSAESRAAASLVGRSSRVGPSGAGFACCGSWGSPE